MTSWKTAATEQQRSNERAWQYRESFTGHRARLTALARGSAAGGRLCILGAGNCGDLDLESLVCVYDEVHLVDLDEAALERAVSTLGEAGRRRVRLHGGVDLSGLQDRVERWAALQVTPDELMAYPESASRAVRRLIGGPFDRVVSACLLSQMHLMMRRVLTENHPLFSAISFCLNLTHLRTLLEIVEPKGQALLVSDVASDEIAPLDGATASPSELLATLLERGDVFGAVDPRLLCAIARDDPELLAQVRLSGPDAVWLWQNGPKRSFLVYALTLEVCTS